MSLLVWKLSSHSSGADGLTRPYRTSQGSTWCRSTIAFSLKVKELGISASKFKELFVSSLLSNLTVV